VLLDPAHVQLIEERGYQSFNETVWRATIRGQSAVRPNIRGARWNPPEVSALYTSLDEATVRAEWAHVLGIQPIPPDRDSVLTLLAVSIERVVDLRDHALLREIGVDVGDFRDDMPSWRGSQAVGEAVEWLPLGGMLVPSARHVGGTNLVIFMRNIEADDRQSLEEVGNRAW
jgi:RES domain-containing protein